MTKPPDFTIIKSKLSKIGGYTEKEDERKMKKLFSLLLALSMTFSLAACGGQTGGGDDPGAAKVSWNASDVQGSVDAAVAATTGKVAIITNTVSQNEEEYRSAEKMVEKYGDRVIHDTMPDNFMTEQEQFISVVNKHASNPDVKCIIINQAVPGAIACVDKVMETREKDDLLVVFCTPQENPDDIVTRADITISVDEINKGTAIAQQAYDMGCKTVVHYSFPRHMAQVQLYSCRDLIKAKCEELGMTFVDATAPDPTGDSGVSGAQMFILEDVPKMVAKYGQETAFFSTNCSMQVPLIEAVVDSGAYYPLPCCPSPYHGFPNALGIESPSDLINGLPETVEAINSKLKEKDLLGHFSTWSVPCSIANTVATCEYAFLWMAGAVEKCDSAVLNALLADYCGVEISLVPYEDPETGKSFDNYFVYQQGFLTFNG